MKGWKECQVLYHDANVEHPFQRGQKLRLDLRGKTRVWTKVRARARGCANSSVKSTLKEREAVRNDINKTKSNGKNQAGANGLTSEESNPEETDTDQPERDTRRASNQVPVRAPHRRVLELAAAKKTER